MLKLHEGLRLKPYKCTANKWTIFIGRNYQDNPFTTEELTLILNKGCTEEVAYIILNNDVSKVKRQLARIAYFTELDEVRRAVLIDMCFNLGIDRLLGFKNTLKCIQERNFKDAAKEMLNSQWAKQVGWRAVRLSKMMETGDWQLN